MVQSSPDLLKEAFIKVKEDIFSLQTQISSLSRQISELNSQIQKLNSTNTGQNPTQKPFQQTNTPPITTDNLTELSNSSQYSLKTPNTNISTGNRGVPTNQQTNQPTNQHTGNRGVSLSIEDREKVSQLLDSLDSLKKEVRFKFKKLTSQEMTIFSAIYELEEKGFIVDYSLLSQSLSLSEISIRDYIRKLISKGIPLIKSKEDNKKVTLSISEDLKKIASLSTINQLREI